MSRVSVAQIFNLPYRGFAIGRVPASSRPLGRADAPQNSILRHGRVQLCATSKTRRFMVPIHALWAWGLSKNQEINR